MNLLRLVPAEAKLIVLQSLVPLFLLFNIVGWLGLPGREAVTDGTDRRRCDSLRKINLGGLVVWGSLIVSWNYGWVWGSWL